MSTSTYARTHATLPPNAHCFQCLENVSTDRDDLLRLNESYLDPDGFLPLRARAGIRLKRRASPMRSGGGGGGSDKKIARFFRGQKSISPSEAPTRPDQQQQQKQRQRQRHGSWMPNGVARPKVLSIPGAWTDGKTMSKAGTAVANGNGNGEGRDVGDDDDDDDGPPPLLDALVRKEQGQHAYAAGAPIFTPKAASATTAMTASTWGTVSPWASGSSAYRPDGWMSRLSAGGGGASSPTFSATAAAAGGGDGASRASAGGKGGGSVGAEAAASAAAAVAATFLSSPKAGAVIHFPPPPQSLLPVFDRQLHGFDASAPQDDSWGELPFLVVDSWGGVGEETIPGEEVVHGCWGGERVGVAFCDWRRYGCEAFGTNLVLLHLTSCCCPGLWEIFLSFISCIRCLCSRSGRF